MNQQAKKGQQHHPESERLLQKNITIMKLLIFVGVSLVIGFLGGIWFADRAHKKITQPMTGSMAMPPIPRGMTGDEPPGAVNMDINQAIQRMEMILKQDPNNLQLLIHLGNLYFDTNQPQKSIESYEKALAIDRNNPNVLTDCGIMYRQLKQFDRALAYFKEAAQIAPNHFQSWYNIGIVYREDLKEYQKAIDAWNQLLKNIPLSENAAQIRIEIENTKKLIK